MQFEGSLPFFSVKREKNVTWLVKRRTRGTQRALRAQRGVPRGTDRIIFSAQLYPSFFLIPRATKQFLGIIIQSKPVYGRVVPLPKAGNPGFFPKTYPQLPSFGPK